MLKKNKLRYNEYYDMQHIYDELYAQSKNGNNFYPTFSSSTYNLPTATRSTFFRQLIPHPPSSSPPLTTSMQSVRSPSTASTIS